MIAKIWQTARERGEGVPGGVKRGREKPGRERDEGGEKVLSALFVPSVNVLP